MPISIGMTRAGRQVRRITLGQPKKASAKEREGAGREPCGLRNSELGFLPHYRDLKGRALLLYLRYAVFYQKQSC